MSDWIQVIDRKSRKYRNVLMAFAHHWNAVVGFYCGKDEWWETSADDLNAPTNSTPIAWMEIPLVPHHPDFKELSRNDAQVGRGPNIRFARERKGHKPKSSKQLNPAVERKPRSLVKV